MWSDSNQETNFEVALSTTKKALDEHETEKEKHQCIRPINPNPHQF